MLYTLVYKTKTEESEYSTSEPYTNYTLALNKVYTLLANVTADPSVISFDVTILNGNLVPCKTEHFVRETITE